MNQPPDKTTILHALTVMERTAAELRTKIAAQENVLVTDYNDIEKAMAQSALGLINITDGVQKFAQSFSTERMDEINAEIEKWK